MDQTIPGIHHVTAIASDPQRNLDFYTKILGLRLVKLTVNFDAPETYHFYFGDEAGHPGTILTFFPWPEAHHGLHGNGQASFLSFSIPPDSVGFWTKRLKQNGIAAATPMNRFDEVVIPFADPDGLQLELIASGEIPEASPWLAGPVPPDQSILGLYGITLLEEGFEGTARLLRDTFGFQQVSQEGLRTRFEAPSNQPGRHVDLLCEPDLSPGRIGAGMIHHVAWRTPNDMEQLSWRGQMVQLGFNVTPVLDRQYFHSIYFREPGGVLFEIATDPPGFTTDEGSECLGSSLKLPPWLEERRGEIAALLPDLLLPSPCPEIA